MAIGALAQLWRYPVKSMGGEELEAAAIGERGIVGDRGYALVDRATGKVASAKHPRRWGRLLACRASTGLTDGHDADARAVITLPDGRSVGAGEPDVDAVLSAALGREVTLAACPPAAPEIERYWPDVEGMPLRDTYSTGAIAAAAAGTFFDYAPIHLLTTATLDHLQALYPAGCFAARRFRPNLVIATGEGGQGFMENDWFGKVLLIGDRVRLRLIDPAPRCVIPTLTQPDLPHDPVILRTIAAHNRPPIPALDGAPMPSVGAYTLVEQGGTIRRGDVIGILP
jgi:uncharacterized protein YcbX